MIGWCGQVVADGYGDPAEPGQLRPLDRLPRRSQEGGSILWCHRYWNTENPAENHTIFRASRCKCVFLLHIHLFLLHSHLLLPHIYLFCFISTYFCLISTYFCFISTHFCFTNPLKSVLLHFFEKTEFSWFHKNGFQKEVRLRNTVYTVHCTVYTVHPTQVSLFNASWKIIHVVCRSQLDIVRGQSKL